MGRVRAHRADPALEERLTDPVERHVAELGRGSTIPTRLKAKPLITGDQPTGVIILLGNNIAFFSEAGGPNNGGVGLSLANCTFENPCGPTDFSQASVNTLGELLPNTRFYFNGGNYTSNGQSISLVPGQSLQGRTVDYSQLATGSARSTLFIPSLTFQGNNTLENMIVGGSIEQGNNSLENLTLVGGFINEVHVRVQGNNNVIKGSQIGLPGDIVVGDGVSVFNESDNNLLIDSSSLLIEKNNLGSVFGFYGNVFTNTTIQNSKIKVLTIPVLFPPETVLPLGAYVDEGAILTLNNVYLQVVSSIVDIREAKHPGASAGLGTVGGTINATNTNIFLSGAGEETEGILTVNLDVPSSIKLVGGTINVIGPNPHIFGFHGKSPTSLATTGVKCLINGANVLC
ncbi:hypothetical protein [Rickettsiella grylli]|uniref:hypothetical protein n=1 Tax=Rickettsiella grylli TaxID=59196 RepID=UPI001FD35AF2|nr:hypothetical protein [Rickettsiella grylli]